MAKLRQFALLVWKNFILQKRRPIATCVELILPLVFSALLVIIRTTVETNDVTDITFWSEFPVNSMPRFNPQVLPRDNTFQVAFVPNNNPTMERIISNFEEFMKGAKSNLEIACPGVPLLLDDTLSNSVNQASNFNLENQVITPQIANLVLGQFPAEIRDFLQKQADEAGQSTSDYVTNQFNTLGAQAFINTTINEFRNDTMECAFDFLGPEARQIFDGSNAIPTNSSSSGNSNSPLDQSFGRVPEIKAISFADEAAFDEYVANDTNLAKTLGGVIFSKFTNETEFSYLIRLHSDPLNVNPADNPAFTGDPDTWETNNLYPPFQLPGPRASKDIYGGKPGYYKEGFLSVMHAVDMSILATVMNTSVTAPENLNLRLKRFPYPPYIEDRFLVAISSVLPLLLMLSFFYTSLIIVKSVVHEKETKLKEYLMMTGLSNWLHWFAWFMKYIVFLGISCVLIAVLYKIPTPRGTVLTLSDGSVIFVYLLSFAASTICFCFMVSVFFRKANVAAAAGGVLYGLSYMPYLFIARRYSQMSWTLKAVSCLLSNVAMANGAMVISMYEGAGVGVQWWNLNSPVTVDDNFTMLHTLIFLWIDAVLYMIIAWYVEGVRPGEYGIPKPWYFPCLKSYWCGTSVKSDEYNAPINSSGELLTPPGDENFKSIPDTEFFEVEVPGLRKVVKIHSLRKVFNPGPKEKVAVDSLDLNMYEGQITVLLGHNGAGKTTTMSMLTGLFPPTSGFANVMGHNITTDIDSTRQSMGLCPQHDILYDQLTVHEHLYFFSRLKGLNSKQSHEEAAKMLAVLQLTDKSSALAKNLSGGMRRKLSVGLALCAGSKFIVLDEPTAGMDPAARRAIWDILQQYRNQCSMLLSTHFMDEADLLGDRIAIMADGKLRCAGSSAFLKNKFGVGYHVVMNKSPHCNVQQLTQVFRSYVPESRLERTAAAEVSYLLPFESSHMFQKLFINLDEQKETLGILSYGASITTMEEVFLAVTEDVQKPVASVNRGLSISSDVRPQESPSHAFSDILKPPGYPLVGWRLWLHQFWALFIKRVIHTRRNLKVGIAQILIPVVFVIIAIVNAKYAPFLEKNKELSLTLDAYGLPNYVRYNQTADIEEFGRMYSSQFPGIAEPKLFDGDLEIDLAHVFDDVGGGFNQRNLIAASLQDNKDEDNSTIAFFNAQAYHTTANTLLYADQAFIRWKSGNSNFTLTVSNNPLPRNTSARIQEQLVGSVSGFMIAFNAVLGFAFLSASFSIFIVRERTDRASLLQSLTGVDPFCFWFSAFTWDFINFFIPCLICLIVFAGFDVVEYLHNGQIWITLLLFLFYAWSSLPLTYILSFFFTLPTTALVSVTIFGAIMGLATIITINVLMLIDDNTRAVGDVLDWVFLVLPQYCIGQGLADLYTNDKMVNVCTTNIFYEDLCRQFGIDFQTNFLAWERYGVGRFLVFMFLEGLIFFAILFTIEYDVPAILVQSSKRIWRRVNKAGKNIEMQPSGPNTSGQVTIDEDVLHEQNRIICSEQYDLAQTDLVWSKNLNKMYAGKKGSVTRAIVAVEDLSFGVPKGECFGLLGINGAGKTTTFKMLTGDIRPTQGTAYINNRDVVATRKLAQQNIGYCPQFDGLIEQMTGWETLQMYARLRGIRNQSIPAIIDRLSRLLHFEEYIHKECGKYSGGNKRKLSTAIALVGGPAVILLDEPSTGMDPGARRKLWETISQICTTQRSIILTSHSMEECEALCTRLAIMVNGQFRCIGGPQHLKTKFGQGYSVELKLARIDSDMDPVKNFVFDTFPGSIVKDEHQGMIAFQVPKIKVDGTSLSLATIFGEMEQAKQQFELRDYSVSQTTLEQVFLSFARQQRETDN